MTDKIVHIELTAAEALVLFEWLASNEALPVQHPSEQTVLWRIEGQLEKALTEPLLPDYRESVDAARMAVASGTPYR